MSNRAWLLTLFVAVGAFTTIGLWPAAKGRMERRGTRAPLLQPGLDHVPAAQANLRRARQIRAAVGQGSEVVRSLARKLDPESSNLVQSAVTRLEERVHRDEIIAAVDLQLAQCDMIVTNTATLDEAEDVARRLRVSGIAVVVRSPRPNQPGDQPERPYRVLVPSADLRRAQAFLARPVWIAPGPAPEPSPEQLALSMSQPGTSLPANDATRFSVSLSLERPSGPRPASGRLTRPAANEAPLVLRGRPLQAITGPAISPPQPSALVPAPPGIRPEFLIDDGK